VINYVQLILNYFYFLKFVLDIIERLLTYREKIRLKRQIWDLIEEDVTVADKLLREIMLDLAKALGAVFFFSNEDYSKILNDIVNEVNAKTRELVVRLENIAIKLKSREDIVKSILKKEEWFHIEPLLRSLTPQGKLSLSILFRSGYLREISKTAKTSIKPILNNMVKNFNLLGSKIGNIYADTEFETIYKELQERIGKELRKETEKCINDFAKCLFNVLTRNRSTIGVR